MSRLYLASVYGGATVGGQAQTSKAEEFIAWWLYRLGNKRAQMRQDDRLMACAQRHAEYLAQRMDISPSMHIGANGSTANERVRASGYKLPGYFLAKGNNVESCTYSHDPIPETVDDLMASPAHHDHMTVAGWFVGHTVYGVGNADAYYVVVTAPVEG